MENVNTAKLPSKRLMESVRFQTAWSYNPKRLKLILLIHALHADTHMNSTPRETALFLIVTDIKETDVFCVKLDTI